MTANLRIAAATTIVPPRKAARAQTRLPDATAVVPPETLALCAEDAALRRSVRQALQACGYAALGSVRIEVSTGTVILRGNLPTFHLKQVAQTLTRQVPGVGTVENAITVTRRC
jgi:osmotically-inducible protein OsmY